MVDVNSSGSPRNTRNTRKECVRKRAGKPECGMSPARWTSTQAGHHETKGMTFGVELKDRTLFATWRLRIIADTFEVTSGFRVFRVFRVFRGGHAGFVRPRSGGRLWRGHSRTDQR